MRAFTLACTPMHERANAGTLARKRGGAQGSRAALQHAHAFALHPAPVSHASAARPGPEPALARPTESAGPPRTAALPSGHRREEKHMEEQEEERIRKRPKHGEMPPRAQGLHQPAAGPACCHKLCGRACHRLCSRPVVSHHVPACASDCLLRSSFSLRPDWEAILHQGSGVPTGRHARVSEVAEDCHQMVRANLGPSTCAVAVPLDLSRAH